MEHCYICEAKIEDERSAQELCGHTICLGCDGKYTEEEFWEDIYRDYAWISYVDESGCTTSHYIEFEDQLDLFKKTQQFLSDQCLHADEILSLRIAERG